MTDPLSNCPFEPVELPTARENPFDPAPQLAVLREQQPMARLRFPDGHIGWLVTSHALGRTVLTDPRFSVRPDRSPIGDPVENAAVRDAFYETPEAAGALLALDPPEHARLRRLQAGYFTVSRTREHEEIIERIVAERLDAMEAAGPPLDLVEAFALPVPSLTICEMLGVPREDRDKFERPSAITMDLEADASDRIAANDELFAYTRGVIAEKRARPTNDLLSELAATGELTDDEMTGVAALLFEAGHGTTATMFAFGTFALLFDRARWEALRADPSLIDSAVEELLRYLTIFHLGAFARTATEDVEIGGVKIAAGEAVSVSLAAANRDPERFADPDAFDLRRDATGQMAFGHGRHICLGQHLARLELQVGFRGLLQRFPNLHLTIPADEVPLYRDLILHGVERLPVAW